MPNVDLQARAPKYTGYIKTPLRSGRRPKRLARLALWESVSDNPNAPDWNCSHAVKSLGNLAVAQ